MASVAEGGGGSGGGRGGGNASRGGGAGARRGRSRPRRGGRGGKSSAPSEAPVVVTDVMVAPIVSFESMRFARDDDVPLLATVWPAERDLIALEAVSDPHPSVEAAERFIPLIAAAQHNSLAAIEYLLANGADVNAIGSIGIPALTAAVIKGHDAAAMLLLESGADVTQRGHLGITPLHAASGYGRVDLAKAFILHPGVDINALDDKDQTPLHHATFSMSYPIVKALLDNGASVTHDKAGFSPMFYAAGSLNLDGTKKSSKKQKPRPVPLSGPGVDIIVALADSYPFLYETFRVVLDRNLRDAIIRKLGSDRVMSILSLRAEAREDAELFNETLSALSRTLKADKVPLRCSLADLGSVVMSMVTEASVNTMQSFTSLLSQPFMLPHITIDMVGQIGLALETACRMCIFGHQPFVDYSVDFLYVMMPAFLRLCLALLPTTSIEAINVLAARFNHFWDMLEECLVDIDFNVQESERFAVLIYAFFHHCQIFPLDPESVVRVRRSSQIDGDDQGKGRVRHGAFKVVGVPKITWFLDTKPVSERFQRFYDSRTAPILHIADDCDDLFFKYFRYSLRVGGLLGKAHYIQSIAARSPAESKPVSLNRFLMATPNDNGDAYEHFVQQMYCLPASSYNISLQIVFLNEPGVGEGPLRELIQIVSKRLFTSNEAVHGPRLFRVAPSGSSYHLALPPHQLEDLQVDNLKMHWEVAGRIAALSLTTSFPLGVLLNQALLNALLDRPIRSIAGFDDELQRHLDWLSAQPLDELCLDFRWTVTDELLGSDQPLCPGGADRVVTDANKEQYILALIEYRLWGTPAQKALTWCFVKGFREVIPRHCLPLLSPNELATLLQGPQTIDFEWMRTKLVTYTYGYTAESPVVVWFWEYFMSIPREKQSQLLQFWSGTPVPPLPGPYCDTWSILPHLRPMTSLPSSATCTHQLSIPRYQSAQQLRAKFDTVIEMGYIGYSNT